MAWWLWPGSLWLDLAALLAAVALDLALPEPPTPVHPVGWMGKGIGFLQRLSPASGRAGPLAAGAAMALAVPAAFAAGAGWAGVGLREVGAAAYVTGGAVLLKTTFAVRGLEQAALATCRDLEAGDLASAQRGLRTLVGRETGTLDAPLVSAAAIESVAENSTDSYIAPWMAFALLGLPGAFAYRAVNTLDSMVGYRGRYEYLGKASARLDDLLNLIPARASAGLMLFAGALAQMPVGRGWRTLWRDRGKTASPNAGWTMSAMAGLLGVRLEKSGHYRLGEGLGEPGPADIRRAVALGWILAALGVALATGMLVARHALL